MKWLCTRDTISFTKGKIYDGKEISSGSKGVDLTNDQGQNYLMYEKHLYKYFKRICPECEQSDVLFNIDDYICDNCVLNNREVSE